MIVCSHFRFTTWVKILLENCVEMASNVPDGKYTRKKKREERKRKKMEAYLNVAEMNDGDRLHGKKRPLATSPDSEAKVKHLKLETSERLSTVNEPTKLTKTGKPWLSGSELEKLRARVRERRRLVMQKPKLYLCLDKLTPGLHPAYREEDNYVQQHSTEEAVPLFVRDLQHLLLYVIEGNITSYKPRWCKLLRWEKVKKLVVVVMENVSLDDCQQHRNSLTFLHETFDMQLELMSPCQYGSSVAAEMFRVPLSRLQLRRKYFTMEERINPNTNKVINDALSQASKAVHKDSYSRLELLLSPEQLVHEHYPMPVQSETYADFVFSKNCYEKVTESSPMYALDCEMCLTSIGKMELTMVAVVNESLETVYETLVKPRNRIVNYLTQYSGVTAQMMKNVTTRLEDVQQTLQKLLPPDVILVGQSLNGDLNSLKMFHPYVIDTSVIYNLSGMRGIKPGLKRLTAHFLGKVIQNSPSGHSPVEDAAAAMELALHKLLHTPAYGDVLLGGDISQAPLAQGSDGNGESSSGHPNTENSYSAQERYKLFFQPHGVNLYQSFFELCKKSKKSAVVVGPKEALVASCEERHLTVTNKDRDTVKTLTKQLMSNFFVWAQLHDLSQDGSTEVSPEDIQVGLQKMDRRLKKIWKAVEPDSLVVVVAAGRKVENDGFHHNAGAFLALTGEIQGLNSPEQDAAS